MLPQVNHHAQVTQCLGSMQPGSWFLAVSHPTGKQPPKPEQLHAFEIPHGGFVKLERGTWHAGPLFDDLDHRDFFNLELSDTNLSDGVSALGLRICSLVFVARHGLLAVCSSYWRGLHEARYFLSMQEIHTPIRG